MKKNVFTFFLLLVLLLPLASEAQLNLFRKKAPPTANGAVTSPGDNARGFADYAGFETSTTDPLKIVSVVINTALSLLGVVFLGLIIYAGFRWMTAQGNEEDVTKAKEILIQAVIGLAIVLAAYAISYFVFNALQAQTLKQAQQSSL